MGPQQRLPYFRPPFDIPSPCPPLQSPPSVFIPEPRAVTAETDWMIDGGPEYSRLP